MDSGTGFVRSENLVAPHYKKNPQSFERGFIWSKVLLKNFGLPSSVFQLHHHTLISTSTPEGSSNFISASTVLEEDE